tara:strand:- start:31 stop:291 length:261 start_codon:yes stop_codon:yes gene_type:complete
MIKKILRVSSFYFLSIFVAASTIFYIASPSIAAQISSGNEIDSSKGIIVEESSETIDGHKTNTIPDLVDDQTFPFIPGFGKNSAKD